MNESGYDNNMYFFSIIIPVYMVEEYLDKCIQSVLNQTCEDYEVILIDDGSPDGSGLICDRYSENDKRIKTVHKVNGGLSSARNRGLDIAKGRYVLFLDSDDFWDDKGALASIRTHLVETNADLLLFPMKRYYGDFEESVCIMESYVDRNKIIDPDSKASIEYMIERNIYRAAATNKVVRRELIKKEGLRFKENYLSEDMDWCGNLLLYARRFDYYDSAFYCYRQHRVGSITHSNIEKLVDDKLFMCEKGYNQSTQLSDSTMSFYLASYYAYEYAVTLGVSGAVKSKKVLSKMKKLSALLEFDLCDKVKKVRKLKRIIGYSLARRTLCLFVRYKR